MVWGATEVSNLLSAEPRPPPHVQDIMRATKPRPVVPRGPIAMLIAELELERA